MNYFNAGDVAFFVPMATLALVAIVFLALSWRDSLKATRELCAPLLTLKRPQFRIAHLCGAILAASIVLKMAILWRWSDAHWLEFAGLAAAAMIGISALLCCAWICCSDLLGRRRRKNAATIQPPQDKNVTKPGRRTTRLRIRFPETPRQTTAFKR